MAGIPYTPCMPTNMFEGEHVRLRGVRPDDWEHFLAWDTDSDAQRFGYQVWPPQGTEAAKAFAREQSEKKPDGPGFFLVIEMLDGTPVGSVSVRTDQRRRSFEYGIQVGRAHWGNGYAEEALVMAFRYLFGELAYHKAQAFVYAFNTRSISAHKKLGMRHEGTMTEAQFTDGRFWDILIFGMTAPEYFDRYGPTWGELPR